MRATKIDNNQAEIVKKLRAIPGISVHITSRLGEGFPDIVVGYNKQVTLLVEIKNTNKHIRLTKDEENFKNNTQTNYIVVQYFEQIIDEIQKLINIRIVDKIVK